MQNENIIQEIPFKIFNYEESIIFIFAYIPRYHSPPKQIFVMIESIYSGSCWKN